ncbi:MAG: hypothetical protein KIB01_02960 [Negativicoccus succinicivorans]|uniref:Uncharacterized protein n=1 Tax=Negativicoccus succinicivorans DORA_17_25 TaxID=1403945 RepID=W1U3P6_9FIRM|nr:hypothetical protein [Negativicoccus succinicivorans]ETI86238.1 MAG: hypothetical protein Q612_NSC00320G0004 [Negativicoccus succinicivorans DORA_17_25]MBS5917308.1 hypothetical protein [Negativicoccus succinicivorans]MDU2184269.1 hypothetical protein [Negativicoccus succinicivorans]
MDEYKVELSPSMMIFEREVVVELIAAVSGFGDRHWLQKNKPIPEYLLLFIEKIQDYRETALDTDSLEELLKIKFQARLVLEVLNKLYELHKI